ncbi:AbrB/MazE/SpoVT family DNA-binding domain-containing protein [Enterococcus sp. BWB1-3]|uniref:DUF998 domain-containing protein n=1 Tax=unclassified Enterococcus TaxID=2608891 RepID=UPI00192103EF|nr:MULTISPECIES: DUF998 domain-containing protein [unclassified Enterococcus]MBL1229180.1 AbrB/MazE/SpoVT family DNA-binding domain-containing protein [Enterococcus sp. BWB1-3]MCB5953398.1 AbrB/MazE/SpoVT family DNA-binding domain-containing protein [Enterococcus sp. CWB-B31]
MKKPHYTIQLPEEVVQELQLKEEEPLQIKIENKKIIIEPKRTKTERQAVSLRWFLIPSLLVSVIFFGFFYEQGRSHLLLTGRISIAASVLILGLLSGICSFIIFFVKGKRKQLFSFKDIYWRNFLTILISFVIILALVLLGFFWLLGILFEGASFDLLTATFIFFVFVGMINYLMIYFALAISPALITTLLISVIIGGVLMSMAANGQLQWWQYNFSFLGTSNANSSWQFNLTLIISALLMIALIDYLFVSLQKSMTKNIQLTILRILLTLTAIDLGAVGFFPNNGNGRLHELHNQAANYLVYMIIILIISIRWLLPAISREFLGISYMIAAVLLIANVLFKNIGYLSLTAFELIAFFLAFSWILLLLQNLQKLTRKVAPVYEIAFNSQETLQDTTVADIAENRK